MKTATRYEILFDDTRRSKPWCFALENDDGVRLYLSKQYKTKAAAASVAARMLK